MPKLSEWRKDHYYYFSGKASELARNHSFAGIAIVWIFKTLNGGYLGIPKKLIPSLICFVVSLFFDLSHYVWGTCIWGIYTRREEKKVEAKKKVKQSKFRKLDQDPELKAPVWYNWPTNTFFAFKLISVCAGYIILFLFLLRFIKTY